MALKFDLISEADKTLEYTFARCIFPLSELALEGAPFSYTPSLFNPLLDDRLKIVVAEVDASKTPFTYVLNPPVRLYVFTM